MFKTMNTASLQKDGPIKVLLYAHHGYGKTYQCRNFENRYGKGLILSGESGLKSVEDVNIDYIPFSSWDKENDPEKGVYSFKGIISIIKSKDFADAGYKWICIDSLTELSEQLVAHLEKEHEHSANGFQMWGDYNRIMLGALKWIRDLPLHATEKNDQGTPRVRRYVVTDEVSGWHGKVRDPRNRLKAYEQVDDITALFARMAMPDDDHDTYVKAKTATKGDKA